jgi:hypothetical protein
MTFETEYGDDWTRSQVEVAVADYLAMLAAELRREDYNKAEHNRTLQQVIGRSRGSIERKHQNISAVLRELEMPWISGYKPLSNYQQLVLEVVEAQLTIDRYAVQAAAEKVVTMPVTPVVPAGRLDEIEIAPPRREPREYAVGEGPPKVPIARKRNYLAIDARNRALGTAGEEFMVEFERRRLWDAGRRDLSEKVEHIAATQGDGLGYDISSFELDGRARLLEVKTTSFAALTPFFVSKNEVSASEQFASDYRLCRLFNFRTRPQFFSLPGSLHQSCHLEPDQFVARVV